MSENGNKPASAPSSGPDADGSLCEYRRIHQQRYEERQRVEEKRAEEAERKLQESADVELARKLYREEELVRETQLASDEEYSRQLYEQLNDTTAPNRTSPNILPNDGVRAPLRTGYSERLIPASPVHVASQEQGGRSLLQDDSMQGAQSLLSDLERGTNEPEARNAAGTLARTLLNARTFAFCVLVSSTAVFLATMGYRVFT